MAHAKFHFNRLMLTLIFGIQASEPPWAWRMTEKAGPDRVKRNVKQQNPYPPKRLRDASPTKIDEFSLNRMNQPHYFEGECLDIR